MLHTLYKLVANSEWRAYGEPIYDLKAMIVNSELSKPLSPSKFLRCKPQFRVLFSKRSDSGVRGVFVFRVSSPRSNDVHGGPEISSHAAALCLQRLRKLESK